MERKDIWKNRWKGKRRIRKRFPYTFPQPCQIKLPCILQRTYRVVRATAGSSVRLKKPITGI